MKACEYMYIKDNNKLQSNNKIPVPININYR